MNDLYVDIFYSLQTNFYDLFDCNQYFKVANK